MLDWLDGRGAASKDYSNDDGPDTPAHIFAARALKTAFFGTPAPPQEKDMSNSCLEQTKPTERSINASSPTKGILIAPGSIITKRKSVSFGVDRMESSDKSFERENTLPTLAEEPESQLAVDESSSSVEKSIRRSLFKKPRPYETGESNLFGKAEQRDKTILGTKNNAIAEYEPRLSRKKISESKQGQPEVTTDMTIDLGQPRSESGKHWMREYQRDHAMSKAEMKRLIKYSQDTKLESHKTEEESTRLRGRLDESEARVRELEMELAKWKANQDSNPADGISEAKRDSNRENKPNASSSDLKVLQNAANVATLRATKLEQENEDFRKTILRVKEEMAKYENRHKKWVEQRKRKDEKHAAERKVLKERIINYRNKLQEEFDDFQEKVERDRAILVAEIEHLRSKLMTASPNAAELVSSGDPLRELLARVHEKSPKKVVGAIGTERTRTLPSKREMSTRTSGANQKRALPNRVVPTQKSSPTILENNIYRRDLASRNSKTIFAADQLPEIWVDENDHENVPPASVMATATAMPSVPVASRGSSSTRTAEPGAARRDIRVKARRGLTARRSPTSPPAGRTGLTPEREAAARARIAQRSAQKQRSTHFFFDDADGDDGKDNDNDATGDWQTESRGILTERVCN